MLMNLSDHKTHSSGLEALARLLELLISYFRVEIGRNFRPFDGMGSNQYFKTNYLVKI